MEHLKYIAFTNEFGLPDIVIFSKHVQHQEMARNRRIFHRGILGAGFIRFETEMRKVDPELDAVRPHIIPVCYGKSVSLGDIPSRPEDEEIAKKILQIG